MAITTLYTSIAATLVPKIEKIKLLVCDVDGVFSDGRIYLGNQGEELKAFHTRDGYGIKALAANGIEVAVITGRRSQLVENRMKNLNVRHILQGVEDKQNAMQELLQSTGYETSEVAAIGDDMPDVGMYELANVNIAVKDAHPLVVRRAQWVTTLPGGYGAVREVADTILQIQGKLHGIQGVSI